MNYELRKVRPDEVEEALALALEVFMEFEAPEYSPRGVETFKEHILDEKIRLNYKNGTSPLYAAFDSGKPVGIIGMRPNKTHISLVFVNKEYHRKGVGTALFRFLINDLSEKMAVILGDHGQFLALRSAVLFKSRICAAIGGA